MTDSILNVVADKLMRDAMGDPSALTPAQRAEREGMNDPERFDEFTGPMDTDPFANHPDWFNGDPIRYTGGEYRGLREFVYLDGHKKGQTGYAATEADSDARIAQQCKDWQDQQDAFRRMRERQSK